MCLFIDDTLTQAFKKRHKTNKKITVYKMVMKDYSYSSLITPYTATIISPGFFKADTPKYTILSVISGGAIHCYRQKKYAERQASQRYRHFVLKCWAYTNDVLGLNSDEIAFKKIFIPFNEIKAVYKKLRTIHCDTFC